jgi:hypothetical protein
LGWTPAFAGELRTPRRADDAKLGSAATDLAEIMVGAGLVRSYDGAKRQPWC